MHEVLVNRLGGLLSLPRKSVVMLTDRPDMTLDVYRGRKTTMQQQQQQIIWLHTRRLGAHRMCACTRYVQKVDIKCYPLDRENHTHTKKKKKRRGGGGGGSSMRNDSKIVIRL